MYDTGSGESPRASDIAALFGNIRLPSLVHGKGNDSEGIVRVVQGMYAAFAGTGGPSTPAAASARYHRAGARIARLKTAPRAAHEVSPARRSRDRGDRRGAA